MKTRSLAEAWTTTLATISGRTRKSFLAEQTLPIELEKKSLDNFEDMYPQLG